LITLSKHSVRVIWRNYQYFLLEPYTTHTCALWAQCKVLVLNLVVNRGTTRLQRVSVGFHHDLPSKQQPTAYWIS